MTAFGELAPSRLPRARYAPATLRLGFTSADEAGGPTPELTAIEFRLARNLGFLTAGLPSCPIAALYAEAVTDTCAGARVGHGIVISEVTLPGSSPVTIEGRLSAYYDLGEGQPRILARVTSSGALPLTYVIPFTIRPGEGSLGTMLTVAQMRFIAGICAYGHPNCFAQTYTFKGIYGHISKFDMTLARGFVHAGRRVGLISAECPARRPARALTLPLARVDLTYSRPVTPRGGISLSARVSRHCEVARARGGFPPRGHAASQLRSRAIGSLGRVAARLTALPEA